MSLPLICLLAALPALQVPAPVPDANTDANTGAKAVLDAAQSKAKVLREARTAHVQAGKNAKDFRGDCAKDLAEFDARLATEKRPEVIQALLVSKLYLLQLAKVEVGRESLLARLRKEVPPTASAWSLEPSLIEVFSDEAAPGMGAYVSEARAKHPDPAIRSLLLFEFFWDRLDAKDEGAWKPAYDTLQTEFSTTRQAKQAKDILEAEQKTGIGRPAPAFSLAALGDASTTYTLDTFKGRYVLLDFWATWCGPCRAEMPTVHAAWAKFKGKPFDILSLSFDGKPEHIAPYRAQAATPMPWKHTFLEGNFKHPLADAYGVKGIPKALLVGPDGRIVANGGDLRGANLEKTLAKFLGD